MKDVNMYVISVKRVKDYIGEVLVENEQYFEYFGYDRYAGSLSTGYPCFLDMGHAEKFKSVDEAVKHFNEDKKKFGNDLTIKLDNYDLNTLGVRKIVLKTKCKLQLGV